MPAAGLKRVEGFEGTCPGEPARFRGVTGVVPGRSLDEAPDLAEGYRAAREVRVRVAWTSGGSSDTAVKAVTVAPCGTPSSVRVVTTVTTVANVPNAWRSSRLSKGPPDLLSLRLLLSGEVPQSCGSRMKS